MRKIKKRPGRKATVGGVDATGPNLSGLDATIQDAKLSVLATFPGPAEPKDYVSLVSRLIAAKGALPALYVVNFSDPFTQTVQQLGADNFADVIARDPERESSAGLMFDLAQAVLQPKDNYNKTATRAFQELVSDLYDGFLSAEDRKNVKPPDLGVIPPLVKWGNPDAGPYTWPIDAVAAFRVKAGVVSLPPAAATQGLVAWSALGHETAGHDVLHADTGLQNELARALQKNLRPLDGGLASYWSDRIDETAADVMGILNMGPAVGMGLIAYFRGLLGAARNSPHLRTVGAATDVHPADIMRGYLAAEVVALLQFSGNEAWSRAIAMETDKDLGPIVLAGKTIPAVLARQSAKIVAQTLVRAKMQTLENHALGEIQDWTDADEAKVGVVRDVLRTGAALPPTAGADKIYAAHIVAGAVVEALATGTGIALLQSRMIALLNALHDQNPAWGPLYIFHPGDITRNFFYDK